MLTALVLSLALSSGPCTTRCGLRAPLEGPRACAELQTYEDATLDAFARYAPGWSRARTCQTLYGWTLLVVLNADADGVFTQDGFTLFGLTEVEKRTVLVGLEDWRNSSLAHELAHVIEAGLRLPEAEGNHERWTERGICQAVNSVSQWLLNDCEHPGHATMLRPHPAELRNGRRARGP